MIHRNIGNRRWRDNQKKERKKKLCQSVYGDGDTYMKYDGMYDKGKIHDEESFRKTNQKQYKGGKTSNRGPHYMPKAHRLGKNWKPSEIRKINSFDDEMDEFNKKEN